MVMLIVSVVTGMSDISSTTPQPLIGADMQNMIRNLNHRTRDLRSEVNKLRRLQVTNMETMRETIHDTYKKLKVYKQKLLNMQYMWINIFIAQIA